ncbi:DUF6703 family protein [Nonomuraea glycinis]|uniref:DUF6703 family protein n=1 Tax=Nonomuraea glycinis TaxID=2047744 RepID=UPI002E0F942A|nr:hypothetical protein OHA68_25895 [Nonomuraea glycinis]
MATNDDRRKHPLAQPRPAESGKQAGRQGGKPKRPLPPGEQFFTPGATGMRKAVEQRSATPLAFLFTQVPKWVPPAVMVALLLTGFVVTNWLGGVAVLPVLAFIVWLAYLSWPSLKVSGKLLRVAMSTFLVLVVATRFGLF